MNQEKEYQCQSCFENNSVFIEMIFCSDTVENETVIYFEVVKTY